MVQKWPCHEVDSSYYSVTLGGVVVLQKGNPPLTTEDDSLLKIEKIKIQNPSSMSLQIPTRPVTGRR